MFINYSANAGITLNTKPNAGWQNDDVIGLIDDILSERDSSCPLSGALDALEDGSLWGDDVAAEVLEVVHAAILEGVPA